MEIIVNTHMKYVGLSDRRNVSEFVSQYFGNASMKATSIDPYKPQSFKSLAYKNVVHKTKVVHSICCCYL